MESSIFTAEVSAKDLALYIISKNKHKKLIFCDSLFVLLSPSNKKSREPPPLIIKLLSTLDSMSNCKETYICWIPSQGIWKCRLGSQLGFNLTPNKFRNPCTDLKPKINKLLHAKLHQLWNNYIHNKLFQIQPTLGEWRPAFRKSRRE